MIRSCCFLCLACILLSACVSTGVADSTPTQGIHPTPTIQNAVPTLPMGQQQERSDFGKFFQEAGVEGAFVLYDLNRDAYLVYNPNRIDMPYLPASTFKIFNSLVALETGVVKDENEIILWDGVNRDVAEWNQDLNMRLAIQYSAVWFYQELARRIGQERMQQYIDQVGYGNGDIGGGIDHFWLDGDLRITARQEVEFLLRLYRNDLPFSQCTMDIVKDILVVEQTSEYVLRAKAGWVSRSTEQLGWWVGYLEQNDDVYFFATNLDIVNPGDDRARMSVTRAILRHLGLLDGAASE